MKLFTCERRPDAKVTAKTCVARQKFLIEKSRRNGYSNGQYKDIENICSDCPVGLKFYKEGVTEGETMGDYKTCAKCGNMKPADTDHFGPANRSSDGLTNACRECRGTNKETPTDPAPVPAIKEKIIETQVETKVCAWEACGKTFERGPGDMDAAWRNRKYCSKECSRKAERQRDRDRKRQLRIEAEKEAIFDPDRAVQIARDITDETMGLVTVCLEAAGGLDRIRAVDVIRAVAEKVGVECQRRQALVG